MTDTFDELRIIAKDGTGIDATDRDVLRKAADELEFAWRTLVTTQLALIDSQARRIALNERLIEMGKKAAALLAGPVTMQLYVGPIAGAYRL